MIELHKLIVHEVIKEASSTTSRSNTSNILTPVDDDSIELVETLLKSYQSDKILYANFDQNPGRYFPDKFVNYKNSTRNDAKFIIFTKEVIGNLEFIIRNKFFAKGGYLVFAEYSNGGAEFLVIFLIRDTEGKILRRTQNSYAIQRVDYLDTSHLAMACRINEQKLDANELNYLSFTKQKQQEVSDYFTDWICVERLESSTEYTQALYRILNELDPPINPDTGTEYPIDEVRNMVYEFAKSNPQKSINLHSLSDQLYNDPLKIVQHAERNQISIDSEFIYDKRALKKFIQLNVNRDGINLKFSRGDIGTKIRPSEENENVVIIESSQFATALKNEINE